MLEGSQLLYARARNRARRLYARAQDRARGSWRTLAVVAMFVSACACDACGGAQKPVAPEPQIWTPPPASATPPAEANPAALQAAPEAPAVQPDAATDAPVSATAPGAPPAKLGGQRSSLGINLGAITYYADQIVFLDLMKQAPDWGLNNGGVMPQLDEHGWPKALASGHQAGFIANAGKGGRFVILYEGSGKLDVTFGGTTVSSAPGRDVIALERGEAHFTLVRTDPKNPMRNIRIVPLENEQDYDKQIFHARFLELVRPFSVLRFMDFFQINGSPQRRWQDRPKPDDYSQGTPKGAAIEYAIELCNRVHADCWLNVPHMADDDYLRQYAKLVAERLDPTLRAYLEYSNEVWNFEHGNWIQQAGERAGMPHEWDTRLRYQAKRSVEMFDIFEKAMGKQRIVRVLAGQAWDLRLSILLDYNKAYQHADAVAVAPYFCGELAGDETAPSLRPLSAQQIAERCDQDIERVRGLMKSLKKVADDHKLPLIGYEGGQHLVTGGAFHEDEKLQEKLSEAQRLPTMGKAYEHYLAMWRDEGGEIMVLYKLVEGASKWGRWGLLENMWQPIASAPKYLASVTFLQRQPRWWVDTRGSAREPNKTPAPQGGAAPGKASKE